jgi:hypothetical protein
MFMYNSNLKKSHIGKHIYCDAFYTNINMINMLVIRLMITQTGFQIKAT